MNNKIVTEIVEFKTAQNIIDEEFINIVDSLEKNFHSKQNGFINTELAKNKDNGKWVMIQHWQTLDDARASSKMMFQTPVTEKFRQTIDPESVKITLLESFNFW